MSHLQMFFLVLVLGTFQAQADFSVVAIGDTGKGNPDQYRVGAALARECKSVQCTFALLLGDNIYDEGISSPQDPQMIEKFEKPYADLEVPFYVALGNHDYGKKANDWKRGDAQVAYSKFSKKWILPSHYYSFEHENTLFIVLDTSRLFHNKDTDKQLKFVRDTLAKNTKKWVVVVAHHPYLSNGKHGNAGKYDGVPISPYSGKIIKDLVEKDLCAKMDLFISGHDHSLQTLLGSQKCPKPLFVVSGGGASVREDLEGKNPVHFQKDVLGFTTLKFTDSQMTITHINVDGLTEHSISVQK